MPSRTQYVHARAIMLSCVLLAALPGCPKDVRDLVTPLVSVSSIDSDTEKVRET